jgi:hypothetical protein
MLEALMLLLRLRLGVLLPWFGQSFGRDALSTLLAALRPHVDRGLVRVWIDPDEKKMLSQGAQSGMHEDALLENSRSEDVIEERQAHLAGRNRQEKLSFSSPAAENASDIPFANSNHKKVQRERSSEYASALLSSQQRHQRGRENLDESTSGFRHVFVELPSVERVMEGPDAFRLSLADPEGLLVSNSIISDAFVALTP